MPVDAWVEVQRHGQDIAGRFAQGFSGLLHSPSFPWPASPPQKPFDLDIGPAAILDIGARITNFGACVNGAVQQFLRKIPVPFVGRALPQRPPARDRHCDGAAERLEVERIGDLCGALEIAAVSGRSDGFVDDEAFGLDLRDLGQFARNQGTINITSTYDSRTNNIESSLVAKGDLWRAEASHGGSSTGNGNSPHYLIQLGPVLFVRDTTLLLPVHLSKQHLLWYGYDRKNGMHSLCPALWSKHRRWLLMSMICLKPFACSFMDVQFPNGQLTYVAGEGLTTSAFFPVVGGLLQAQGQFPGDMRFSFSCKSKGGTRFTPIVQWPDKSFSLGVVHALAWKRYGLMEHPSLQISICPTFGGSNPGIHAEFIHSLREKLSLIGGCSWAVHPSAFASVSLGKSKWNGQVGKSGIVLRVETPLGSFGRPSFSIQLNSGIEF